MNRSISALAIVWISAGLGCMYTPPGKTSGPSTSPEGVTVRVLGVRCIDERDAENGNLGTSLGLRLEASNQSGSDVEFRPNSVRVASPPGYVASTIGNSVSLKPGQRTLLTAHLQNDHEGVSCSEPLRLNLSSAAVSGGHAMMLSPIEFIE